LALVEMAALPLVMVTLAKAMAPAGAVQQMLTEIM